MSGDFFVEFQSVVCAAAMHMLYILFFVHKMFNTAKGCKEQTDSTS